MLGPGMARPLALVVFCCGVSLCWYGYGKPLEANRKVRAGRISHDGEELTKALGV